MDDYRITINFTHGLVAYDASCETCIEGTKAYEDDYPVLCECVYLLRTKRQMEQKESLAWRSGFELGRNLKRAEKEEIPF